MREFLMLAYEYESRKHGIGGWYVSEKLDGMRAYWDGGITRGFLTSRIWFANTDKDYRRVTPPHSTGLWSRYGKPIAAPEWFLDQLPEYPLDGELYMGHGNFQEVMSTVKQFEPDSRWEDVKYMVFDIPSDYMMFSPGKINNPTFSLEIEDKRGDIVREVALPAYAFYRSYEFMIDQIKWTKNLQLIYQTRLPMGTPQAVAELDTMLNLTTDNGGEGLMLRKPESVWEPKRSNDLLKVKKYLDSEATVIGYYWGKGKLTGLMGSLLVKWTNGIEFELSGFTDSERVLTLPVYEPSPGSLVADDIRSSQFPISSQITFRYRDITKAGVPKHANYWRKT